MPLDLRGFYPQNNPNQNLNQISNTIEQNTRYKQEKEHREQKEKEADQYRNYNIISDNTDLSKSLTGIPAIDRVYSDKMKEVYNELIGAASKLSPLELAGMVNEKSAPIFTALNAARADYTNGQKRISEMTSQSKELDRAKLTNDLTNRAIQNYIDPKTGKPVSPDAVHSIDFSIYDDPEYLSDFVSDENLVKGIRNPIGADKRTVLAGKDKDYTKYETKNTLWTEPAYDETKFDDKGFYTGGDMPTVRIKAQKVPIGSGSIDVVTDDVYNAFSGDKATRAALIARAKMELGADNYAKFNANEKEKAEKHALYKYIKENDDTQFHPVETKSPPVYKSTTNVNTGGGKDAGAEWVKRAVGAMEKGDKQGMEDVFSELLAGDMKELKGVEDLGGGKVKVTVMPNPKYDMVGQLIQESTKPVERVFDINDRQLPYRLANLRQTIMGGDVKLERTRFDRPKTDTPKPNNEAYKTDKTSSNWKNNGDGTFTYIPTGQKIDSKTGKLK